VHCRLLPQEALSSADAVTDYCLGKLYRFGARKQSKVLTQPDLYKPLYISILGQKPKWSRYWVQVA
jgi:hypothetical protein